MARFDQLVDVRIVTRLDAVANVQLAVDVRGVKLRGLPRTPELPGDVYVGRAEGNEWQKSGALVRSATSAPSRVRRARLTGRMLAGELDDVDADHGT